MERLKRLHMEERINRFHLIEVFRSLRDMLHAKSVIFISWTSVTETLEVTVQNYR